LLTGTPLDFIMMRRTNLSPVCVNFTAAMQYDFDMIIDRTSISMASFLLYHGEMESTGPYLPSIRTSLWTAVASLTQAVGSIAIGTISDE